MRRMAVGTLGLALLVAVSVEAQPPDPTVRTFAAPLDRVFAVAESVLQSLGWEIDKSDRAVGWILTESRGLEFKDFAVYGAGTRHTLRLVLRREAEGHTSVRVEREVYREERILWMKERKPLTATDQAVEIAVLDAIARSL